MSEKPIDPTLLAEAEQGIELLRRTLRTQSSGDTPPPPQPTVGQSIEEQEIVNAVQAIREAKEFRAIGDTPLPGPLPISEEAPTNNSSRPESFSLSGILGRIFKK